MFLVLTGAFTLQFRILKTYMLRNTLRKRLKSKRWQYKILYAYQPTLNIRCSIGNKGKILKIHTDTHIEPLNMDIVLLETEFHKIVLVIINYTYYYKLFGSIRRLIKAIL